MSECWGRGRLGNQIIRNLAISFIAKKHDLKVRYSSHDLIKQLGIELYSGKNIHTRFENITEENYYDILHKSSFTSNLNVNGYFQTMEITNTIYDYLQGNKESIMNANRFNERYSKNNDLFIHIRLGDVAIWNPGLQYYLNAISSIAFDNLYIASDDFTHSIIDDICKIYPAANLVKLNEIDTIQFASTCKNIILSHGSFSAVIGYLAFFSSITYPDYTFAKTIWFGDMCSIPGWKKL